MQARAAAAVAIAWCALTLSPPAAQTRITTPKEHFGFALGDDYQLANYTQIARYWGVVDRQSDRVRVQTIGKTAEGRPQLMAIVTSPANHRDLDTYRTIS